MKRLSTQTGFGILQILGMNVVKFTGVCYWETILKPDKSKLIILRVTSGLRLPSGCFPLSVVYSHAAVTVFRVFFNSRATFLREGDRDGEM